MHQKAFSLIELLISLSILSILTAIALPPLRDKWNQAYYQFQAEQFLQTIRYAQREAHTRDLNMGVCPSANLTSCTTTKSARALLVFVDENKHGIILNSAQILAVQQFKLQTGAFLRIRSFPRYRDYLQYHPRPRQAADNGTIWYCPARGKPAAWTIRMNRGGRVRVVYAKRGEVLKDSHLKELDCDDASV